MLQITWKYPTEDGGSSINCYEVVKLLKNGQTENTKDEIVYKGPELSCSVSNLLPGRIYPFKLRAINEIGKGDWSTVAELATAPSCPDIPDLPEITVKSASCLVITWNEPSNNGSPVIEYILEWSMKKAEGFKSIHVGQCLRYEFKGHLAPAMRFIIHL